MIITETIHALREARADLDGIIGVVPTMGYLHEGHLSLVAEAIRRCDSVIVSIFVNPTQFGTEDDLDEYPRDRQRDTQLLRDAGVEAVFTPTPQQMYPPRFQTHVIVDEVTQGREGAERPGHFKGVATVVTKLFNLTQPDLAFFGQKDAQQVVVLRQMVRDLNMRLSIVVCPVVREADGLAQSSRNVYLDADERAAATVLHEALSAAADLYDIGERHPDALRQMVRETIAAEPLALLDYVSLADARTLNEIESPTDAPLLLSLAAQVGKPRLLDNMLLPAALNTVEGATATLGAHDD